MDAIKDIIPNVIGPLSAGKGSLSNIVEEWLRISAQPAKTSSVESLKDGCLTVHVDCSGRRVKMEQNKDDYLQSLNKTHPEIKMLRFKVGRIT